MKKRISIILVSLLSIASTSLHAQEFFSTEDAPSFITFGARLGFNTSNRTFPKGAFNLYNHNSWGTGFNAGIIANLNFKEYLSLQPGLFFESRSGNFSYVTDYLDYSGNVRDHYEMGHWRGYYFTVPFMGIVKFNLAENIKWSVEFGPYVQFSLKQTGQNNVTILERLPLSETYNQYTASLNKVDFGFKMGSGLTLFQHYYVGFHYLGGACNAWGHPSGGKNKSWTFTVGYDF